MDIRHVVVLMLENRSFDSMLGMLYPSDDRFDGLTGTETNIWHRSNGSEQRVPVWKAPDINASSLSIPDPDPGEAFRDIQVQLRGIGSPAGPFTMGGFVDNYMLQPPDKAGTDPQAVMHYFTPDQVPVISTLARAFGVSDRWHASAPCQTWPNRFFAHAGTAAGFVNNTPGHFPYDMVTVFDRLSDARQDWRVYYHDFPQCLTLTRLWPHALGRFHNVQPDFLQHAASGDLPAYSFIEPRYFADPLSGMSPNDEHPPHNIAHGEALIADVYNALRAGPAWPHTLLLITFDEHGGCFDHVPPPAAVSPGGPQPDGFAFDYFGVRVPAVIVSPYMRAGSIVRPAGATPFDHTSIIATLRRLHGFPPLTPRDAAAPDLLAALADEPLNDGPAQVTPAAPVASSEAATLAARPANDMQQALRTSALRLPKAGADLAAHVRQAATLPAAVPGLSTVGEAVQDVASRLRDFLAPH